MSEKNSFASLTLAVAKKGEDVFSSLPTTEIREKSQHYDLRYSNVSKKFSFAEKPVFVNENEETGWTVSKEAFLIKSSNENVKKLFYCGLNPSKNFSSEALLQMLKLNKLFSENEEKGFQYFKLIPVEFEGTPENTTVFEVSKWTNPKQLSLPLPNEKEQEPQKDVELSISIQDVSVSSNEENNTENQEVVKENSIEFAYTNDEVDNPFSFELDEQNVPENENVEHSEPAEPESTGFSFSNINWE